MLSVQQDCQCSRTVAADNLQSNETFLMRLFAQEVVTQAKPQACLMLVLARVCPERKQVTRAEC